MLTQEEFILPAIQIMPSILAADFGDLRAECNRLIDAGADQLHIDIMDGVFVPNISFGTRAVELASGNVPLNVHLMIIDPLKYIDAYIQAGSNTISIHVESKSDIAQTLKLIQSSGVRSGITLNPQTSNECIYKYLDMGIVDEILVMSVEPGFGGQQYMSGVEAKLKDLRERWPEIDIAVDGGIDDTNISSAVKNGANLIVSGSHLYRQGSLKEAISELRNIALQNQ